MSIEEARANLLACFNSGLAGADEAVAAFEGFFRVISRDEFAKISDAAEAERRKRLDDFKRGISPMFVNLGASEEDMAHLNCPACGGSGHIDDAKLSPAPVGEDGPPPCKCGARDAFGHSESCVAEYDAWKAKPAPTPPAKDTEGELERWNYDRTAGVLSPNPHGYWTNWRIATDRIADLEARLAEAGERGMKQYAAYAAEGDRADRAERALADATKRIEALEAGLALAANRLDLLGVGLVPGSLPYIQADEWVREARALLSPASEGKTDG